MALCGAIPFDITSLFRREIPTIRMQTRTVRAMCRSASLKLIENPVSFLGVALKNVKNVSLSCVFLRVEADFVKVSRVHELRVYLRRFKRVGADNKRLFN